MCFSNDDLIFRELFLGSLVSQLMKIPEPGEPINSVQDLVKQNITIFEYDYLFEAMKNYLMDQNSSEWKHVAKTMVAGKGCGSRYCADNNDTYQYLIKHMASKIQQTNGEKKDDDRNI